MPGPVSARALGFALLAVVPALSACSSVIPDAGGGRVETTPRPAPAPTSTPAPTPAPTGATRPYT
ncbi:MAG: hypothetical protein WA940_16475, partial [Sphingopyxis sp.]